MPDEITTGSRRHPDSAHTRWGRQRNQSRDVVRFSAVLAAVTLLASHSAVAQKPKLVLTTGGPAAEVRAIEFSADSSRMYIAGFDKEVSVWDVGMQPGQAPTATRLRALRWAISRADQGRIFAMDVARTTGQMAFGGSSAFGTKGDVILVDPVSTNRNGLLPSMDTAAELRHESSVCAIDYSPSGQQVAVRGMDGALWISDRNRRWRKLLGADPDGAIFLPRPTVFLDENHLAVSIRPTTSGKPHQIHILEVSPGQTSRQARQQSHAAAVTALTVDQRTGRWASAASDGSVYVWKGATDTTPESLHRVTRPPASGLAFLKSGELLVSRCPDVSAARKVGEVLVEVWRPGQPIAPVDRRVFQTQLTELEIERATELAGRRAPSVLAVSPDERLLAVADPLSQKTWLLGLDPQRPLSNARTVSIMGLGSPIQEVQFADQAGLKLRIVRRGLDGNAEARETCFDLDQAEVLPPDQRPDRWVDSSASVGGWSIASVTENGHRIGLQFGAARAGDVVLNDAFQGPLRSTAWLKDAQGRPWALIVGTASKDGVFVYELDRRPGQACRLIRAYRDHAGAVRSLSVSPNGKLLASGSDDQTVKIWNLDGLQPNLPGRALSSIWGGTWEVRANGQLYFTAVTPGGLLDQRDIQAGDQVLQAFVAGGTGWLRSGRQIVARLEQGNVWDQWYFDLVRNGKPLERIAATPAWDPMATLFTDTRSEWAIWTPEGYYQASPRGDSLFGWQLNRARDVAPEFFQADQFRDELERPDLIKSLFALGNLKKAVQQAGNGSDTLDTEVVAKLAEQMPSLAINQPVDGQRLRLGQTAQVIATARFPEGVPPLRYRASLRVNSVPLSSPVTQLTGRPGEVQYRWQFEPFEAETHVEVWLERLPAGPESKYVKQRVHVIAEPDPVVAQTSKPKIYLLTVAAEDYPVKPLNFAIDDVEGFKTVLTAGLNPEFDEVVPHEAREEQTLKSALTSSIKQYRARLEKIVKPEDLLILFVAGHGKSVRGNYYFIPPDPALAQGNRNDVIQQVGIPWADFMALSTLQCRKICFLDTCYSGAALEDMKDLRRPADRNRFLLISSADANETAGEDATFGHGYFTYYLLKGMRGEADRIDPDGWVTFPELIKYVENEVYEFSARRQTPRSDPLAAPSSNPEFSDFSQIRLIKLDQVSVRSPESSE